MVELHFERAEAAETGCPDYDPRHLLNLYLYDYLNQIRSSRRLEAECHRNVELMWLLGGGVPRPQGHRRVQADTSRCGIGGTPSYNCLLVGAAMMNFPSRSASTSTKNADLVDGGMTREDAKRVARRKFVNVTLIEERSREIWQNFFVSLKEKNADLKECIIP
jgi:Transposase domain (DUF772)